MDMTGEPYPKRRIDAMSGVMLLVTLAALGGAAWMRFGRSSVPEGSTADVAAVAPPLRLIDLETSEPVVLVGLNSKVVWVVFWSAGAASGQSCLTELESATKRLRTHRRFAMVMAAVESERPGGGAGGGPVGQFQAAGLSGRPRDPSSVPRRECRSSLARPDRRRWPDSRHGPGRQPARHPPDRRGGPPTTRRAGSGRRDAVRFRDTSSSLAHRLASHAMGMRCTLAKPRRM